VILLLGQCPWWGVNSLEGPLFVSEVIIELDDNLPSKHSCGSLLLEFETDGFWSDIEKQVACFVLGTKTRAGHGARIDPLSERHADGDQEEQLFLIPQATNLHNFC
jgi:hypothetical protein